MVVLVASAERATLDWMPLGPETHAAAPFDGGTDPGAVSAG